MALATKFRFVLRNFSVNSIRSLRTNCIGVCVKQLGINAAAKFSNTTLQFPSSLRFASTEAHQHHHNAQHFSSCTVAENGEVIHVEWKDGLSCDYPLIYLRDNCQCKVCYDSDACQRRLETVFEIDMKNLKAKNASLSSNCQQLEIEWKGGHVSNYDSSWLIKRVFPKTELNAAEFSLRYPTTTWGSELCGKIPNFDFQKMKTNELEVLSWLEALSTKGIALLQNTKAAEGSVKALQEIINSNARCTNYGEIFHVKSKPNPSNLAYTVGSLLLHTDLPFYKEQPGIQILHFLKHRVAYGGENILVDGFRVANILREEQPEYFDLLTKVNFEFFDRGTDAYGEFFLQNERPCIELNKDGVVDSVAMNNHVRGAFINAPSEVVQRAYRAMYALYEIAHREENLVTNKCDEGEMLTFNNRRVMHGRTAYSPDTADGRVLEGCYFDWDEAYSKIRRIRQRHGMSF